MSEPRRYSWDQQADETDPEYAQFKAYQCLGSSRSIDKAYRRYVEQVAGPDEAGKRGKRAPGNWNELAVRQNWKQRAVEFDCTQMRAAASRIATLWVAGIETLAVKAVQGARKYNPGEPAWASVLDTFKVLATHLTSEGVRAVGEAAGLAPPPPVTPGSELIIVGEPDDGVT